MRALPVLAVLLVSTAALAKKPKAPPRSEAPPLEDAVRAFLAGVDAMTLASPFDPARLIGFTMDETGGPMVAVGSEGWSKVRDVLTGWKAEQGTIVSTPTRLVCDREGTLGWCATQYTQHLTHPELDPMQIDVRGTFVFELRDGAWVLVHWHESAPAAPSAEE